MRLKPLLLAGLLAAPAAGQADDNRAVRAAAQAFEAAQRKGNRATLEAMLAPDFLLVRGSGRVGDRRDFIAGFTDPGAHLESFEVLDPLFLRASPDTVIVGGEARGRGMENGRPFAAHFRYADTFVHRGGRWLVVYEQVTPLPD